MESQKAIEEAKMETMKARESGMPDEGMWSGFFDPGQVLERLGLTADVPAAVDLGCGYGTFTIPAARRVRGTVWRQN